MHSQLMQSLEPGEKILWQSRPEAFKTFDVTHRKPFILSSAISAAAAVLIILLYRFFVLPFEPESEIALLIIIAAVTMIGPVSALSYASKLRRQTLYAATNLRLVIIAGGIKYASYESISQACFKTDADGHTSLLCGPCALNLSPGHWRSAALFPLIEQEEGAGPVCRRFAFYALPDSEELKKIISPYMPSAI